MTKGIDRDPTQQVQILPAVGVGDHRAGTGNQLDLRGAEVVHQRVRPAGGGPRQSRQKPRPVWSAQTERSLSLSTPIFSIPAAIGSSIK